MANMKMVYSTILQDIS